MKQTLLSALLLSVLLSTPVRLYCDTPIVKRLKAATSWGYLLQNVTDEKIIQSPFELVVIEPQLEFDQTRMFDKATVDRMRAIPNSAKRRILLAYLSIGEAETYRPYWQKSWSRYPPDWLGKENPNWAGNFKTRYWHEAWQRIILKQLDMVLTNDFDGVYLDIVDAWEYWSNWDVYKSGLEHKLAGDPIDDEHKAAKLMLEWLKTLAKYSRKTSPFSKSDFLIFPQNGERLLEHLARKDQMQFWEIVSGIGVESVFFFGERDENNAQNIDRARLRILQDFVAREKPVLSAEYLTYPKLKSAFYTLAGKYNFLPYATIRELDRLMPPAP